MKGHRPPTFSKSFRNVSRMFSEKFLMNEDYESLLSKIAFFKEHPKVNDKVLEYAQVIGFIFLITLVIYANGNDLYRWLYK